MRGVSIRTSFPGNTLDSFRAARDQGVRYVEADLFSTEDGVLVSAHEPFVPNCGDVRALEAESVLRCRLPMNARVASLRQLLEIPFNGIFLDLKETKSIETAEQAVQAAAEAVTDANRQGDVVLMVYRFSEEILRIIRHHGLRAGLKGYPKDPEAAERIVRRAARVGFEMVCVKAKYVTPELLERSAELGVWHLPWSVDLATVGHWRELAKAGAGGIIVVHFKTARDQVAPHWVDITEEDPPDVEIAKN